LSPKNNQTFAFHNTSQAQASKTVTRFFRHQKLTSALEKKKSKIKNQKSKEIEIKNKKTVFLNKTEQNK
jgi:hypothetical protein